MSLLNHALKTYMSVHDKSSAIVAIASLKVALEYARPEDVDTILLYIDTLTKNYLEQRWHVPKPKHLASRLILKADVKRH